MSIILGILILMFFLSTIGNLARINKERDARDSYNIPNGCKVITIRELDYNNIKLISNLTGYTSLIWKDNLNLYIVAKPMFCKDYGKIQIPLNEISYYTRIGDFYTMTKGGGSSITGAVAGGVIAGGAGALVGSRKKVKTKEVDRRTTILKVTNCNGEENIIKFSSESYDIFFKLIPNKEKSIVEESLKRSQQNTNDNIVEKIKNLAELQKEGLLTEEEFNSKKNELLSRL